MRLYGKNPVIERLRINPQSVRKIYLEEGLSGAYIRKKALQWKIPIYTVPKTKMQKMSGRNNTQGVLVDVGEFEYNDYQELLEYARQKKYSLIFLDGLTDPQNLGVIIRSLGCFGHFAVILPTHDSVPVTEAVLRVATGGDNYVRIAQVKNLANAIKKAKEAGFWIAGSVVEDGNSVYETTLNFPLGLVIGSEQKGIRPIIQKLLDSKLTIPMYVHTMSLNAAQATSLLAYEITRQKYLKKQSRRDAAGD